MNFCYQKKQHKIRMILFAILLAFTINIVFPLSVLASEDQTIIDETITNKDETININTVPTFEVEPELEPPIEATSLQPDIENQSDDINQDEDSSVRIETIKTEDETSQMDLNQSEQDNPTNVTGHGAILNNSSQTTEVKTLTIDGSGYVGSSHRIRSSGASKNGILYQFWIKDLRSNKWTMIQDYSKSSASWTPIKPGKYLYGVHIKDEKSSEKLDAHLYQEITIKDMPVEVKTLTIDGSSYVGSNHRIRSFGTSPNGVLYQFWIKDLSTNKWSMIQDYSKSSASWTPTKAGKYLYGVHIKDEKSNKRLDAHLYEEITIKGIPVEAKNLTIDGSGYVDGIHRIRSYGTSLNGVLYQFWVKDLSTNKWTMIQDYSKSSAAWVPAKPGKYLYGVHIKDEKSTAKLDTHLYKEITIKPAEVKTLTIDGLSFVGGNLRIRSYGESGNGALYQFWIKDLSTNKWTMIQDYSKNSALWKPKKAGDYIYGVHIKDEKSTAKLDTHLYKQITIKSASIVENYYDYTLEEVLKKQMSVLPQTDYYGGGWKNADVSDVRYFLDPNNFINDRIIAVKINALSDVRNLPTTSGSIVITQVKQNEICPVLEESNGWYKIIANSTRIGWVSGSDVTRTSTENKAQILQFLDLSKPANISEADLNNFLIGKGKLEGYGKAFKQASIKHNINEVYLVSHSLLETGNGKSDLVTGILVDAQGRMVDKNYKLINSTGNFIDTNGNLITDGQAPITGLAPYTTVHNILGIGAYDSDPIRLGAKRAYQEGWTSIDKAIVGGAEFVSENYIQSSKNKQNTLYKIRWNPGNPSNHQYATDIGWAYKQVNRIKELYDLCSNYILYYDFTIYK